MTRLRFTFLIAAIAWMSMLKAVPPTAGDAFPVKPIKIIVYTGPGGLIDITARKFSQIAAKHTDVNFVVENKPGAGGIVALKKTLQAPADGYSLYACTKSNIAKFVQAGGADYVDALHWTAMLMADPECVITNNKQLPYQWVDLAASGTGPQNWVGPAAGGLDHVTAMKIWDKTGIDGNWIPFKSGGKAIAALLGKQGLAYVGNPRDVLGNPDLHIAAVSSPTRLPAFPDAPTFTELGLSGLENEYMWRGFALKKGVSPDIVQWYVDLCQKVTDDPEWQEFWASGGIQVELVHGEEFAGIVKEDVETFSYYLEKSAILSSDKTTGISKLAGRWPLAAVVLFLTIVLMTVAYFMRKGSAPQILGRVMVVGFFLILCTVFFLQTLTFPTTAAWGPAVVPRLWIIFLVPLSILLLVRTVLTRNQIPPNKTKANLVFTFMGFLVLYLLCMMMIGYFISTFIFIVGGIAYLGYTRWRTNIIVAAVWILFSYVVFYRVLFVPLPLGIVFERLF